MVSGYVSGSVSRHVSGYVSYHRTLDKKDVVRVCIGVRIEVRMRVCIGVCIGGVKQAPFHEFRTTNEWRDEYNLSPLKGTPPYTLNTFWEPQFKWNSSNLPAKPNNEVGKGAAPCQKSWMLWGSGFRVWDLGFRVWGLGFRVWGLGSGV